MKRAVIGAVVDDGMVIYAFFFQLVFLLTHCALQGVDKESIWKLQKIRGG